MSKSEEVSNQSKSCASCKFFDSRTGFCRKDPPQVVVNADGYYVAVFPKIQLPFLDFCFCFSSLNDPENKLLT